MRTRGGAVFCGSYMSNANQRRCLEWGGGGCAEGAAKFDSPVENDSVVLGYVEGCTSLIRNRHAPQNHYRALGAGLLKGPGMGLFLMSEVPM